MYYLTSLPLAQPLTGPDPVPLQCLLGPNGLLEPAPKPHRWQLWLKLILGRDCSLTLKTRRVSHVIPVLLSPVFSFLLPASAWLCPNCLIPIARSMNPWARVGTEPESTSQKCPRDSAAVLVTAGQPHARSHGFIYGYLWMLHGSSFNSTFNPLLDRAAVIVGWLFRWLDALNFIFTIADLCRYQAGV